MMSPRWFLAAAGAACAGIVVAAGEAVVWAVQHRHPPTPPADLEQLAARIDRTNAARGRR